MAAAKNTVSVLVKVAPDHRGQISEVVDELKKAGLEVGTVMERFGRVQGRIAPDKQKKLEAVRGVEEVRPELTFTES